MRRVLFGLAVSALVGAGCFAAWVLELIGGNNFRPYADQTHGASPLQLAASDLHLYVAIGSVMALLFGLHFIGSNPFGAVQGLWRGAVASAIAPAGYILLYIFVPPGGPIVERMAVAGGMLIFATIGWLVVGIPLIIASMTALFSWPFRRAFARAISKSDGQTLSDRRVVAPQ
jgi:hypothetical protein